MAIMNLIKYEAVQGLWKDDKYSAIKYARTFVPQAIETLGSINFKVLKFPSELNKRLTIATDDPPRLASFLFKSFQHISILIKVLSV